MRFIAGEEIKVGVMAYISELDGKIYNCSDVAKDPDMFIENFVDSLNFELLVFWADIFNVEHQEDMWSKAEWSENEDEFRMAVGDAIKKQREHK